MAKFRKLLSVVILLYLPVWVAAQQDIKLLLENEENISFKTLSGDKAKEQVYILKIKQPIDHSDTTKGYFFQKAYLTHQNIDNPIVMITAGYSVNMNRISEPTKILQANQIFVEHRYFGESAPDSLDYKYLNLKQATADLHNIFKIFKKIYSGKWVSTGISKGGSTSIFYRYYYPDDMDASIVYVAPFTNSVEDKRIYNFLDTVGTKECRNKLLRLQKKLLSERVKVLPMLKSYAKDARMKFTSFSLEEAFELAVLEFPFTFWQWGGKCYEIPEDTAALTEQVGYFLTIDPLSFFCDRLVKYYEPHYYQAASEMGYYGYDITKFKGLINALSTDKNPSAAIVPKSMKVEFDDSLLTKVNKWLQKEGDRFIYIYGAKDTWSACAVYPPKNIDSKCFMLKGKDHGSARISGMNEEEKKQLESILELWLSVDVKMD